ncbi:YdeI/OmpD-associated family protein [Spirosoma soli]|uniref:YdeI/OmpD-associated family protein n=1 Tax=Spirosoma soli TaxID=1770529 RepID=A0ABW5M189_9BACT
MPHFTFEQPIRQLEKRQGGYYHLIIDADIVKQFEKQRATRLKCLIDQKVSFSCGLNHLGDGNFYIIVATQQLKKLGKQLGDTVVFDIFEDPNPLGVDIPEVLQVLLEQDDDARKTFDGLTDGKKRSLIYTINSVKDLDKQVSKALTFLNERKAKSQ